jgi:hypothetical protein
MSAKKSSGGDWWETLLWVGVFLLVAIFIYQLLKLWQAGVASASNAATSLGQAFDNTVAAVENGFNNLLTAPATFLQTLFGAVPDLLNLIVNFAQGLFAGDIFSNLAGFFGGVLGSLFASPNAVVTTGLGSSSSGTIAAPTPSQPATLNLPGNQGPGAGAVSLPIGAGFGAVEETE